jgi:hypothetical protein
MHLKIESVNNRVSNAFNHKAGAHSRDAKGALYKSAKGYNLQELSKPEASLGNKALTTTNLLADKICMRNITIQEAILILDAMKSNKARFHNNGTHNKILSYLEAALTQYTTKH